MRRDFYNFKRLIFTVIVLLLAGFIQNTALLNIGALKPNVSLVVLIVTAFFITNSLNYLILVLIAGVFLRFEPGLDLANIVFTMIALASFLAIKKMPGQPFLINLFLIALSTFVFYLVLDWRFLAGEAFIVGGEMVYNVILGSILFAFFDKFLGYEKKFRFTYRRSDFG